MKCFGLCFRFWGNGASTVVVMFLMLLLCFHICWCIFGFPVPFSDLLFLRISNCTFSLLMCVVLTVHPITVKVTHYESVGLVKKETCLYSLWVDSESSEEYYFFASHPSCLRLASEGPLVFFIEFGLHI